MKKVRQIVKQNYGKSIAEVARGGVIGENYDKNQVAAIGFEPADN